MLPLGLVLAFVLWPPQPEPAVRFTPATPGGPIELRATLPKDVAAKLPAGKLTQDQGEELLQLHLLTDGKAGPAMLGAYVRQGEVLTFVPRFPLLPEGRYRARLLAGTEVSVDYAAPPRPKTPPATVTGLWPTAETLPANHLRFYIHFSRPMRGGQEIFDQIQLLDGDGKKIEDPWLRDELWDATGTLLVLYIHPGRIKWGVLLRMLLGPVLEPNRNYTLVLGAGLRDADGQPLGKEVRKAFKTTAEERLRLDLSTWKVAAPTAGGRDALTLTFPRPLDHMGLERFLRVLDGKGNAVEGKIEVSRDAKTWKFTPASVWQASDYKLAIDERLEDPCGNTPTRPFDVDMDAPPPPPQPLTLAFRPRK